MSRTTWTPEELSCELKPRAGLYWRAVEAQHKKSTMKLVDSNDEQRILEEEIEQAKPAVPQAGDGFDYLLYTPFRYHAFLPKGSRFRRAGFTEGVFYCCESPITAMAEKAFWQLVFFAESPATPFPANPAQFTVFSTRIRTSLCLDLTEPPLVRDAALWTDLADYSSCQEIADKARQCAAEAIRYRSVRDPSEGYNLAVLSMNAFAAKKPDSMQSWHLQLRRHSAWAKCEAPARSLSFDTDLFFRDPRLAPLQASD